MSFTTGAGLYHCGVEHNNTQLCLQFADSVLLKLCVAGSVSGDAELVFKGIFISCASTHHTFKKCINKI